MEPAILWVSGIVLVVGILVGILIGVAIAGPPSDEPAA